jgi:hypothetical protein
LIAEGTAEAPVVFTSIGDDTAGGDTGGDGSAAVPGPMDWGGLLVPAESSDAVMALNNVRLSFASVAVDVQGPSLVKLRGRVLGSAVGVRSTGVLVDATGVDWGSPLGPNTSEAQLVQGSVAYVPWTGWQAPVLPALTPQSYDPPTFTCEDYVAFGLRGSGEAPQYPRSDDGTSAYGSDWSTGFGGFNWEAYNAYRAGVLEIRPETTFKAIAVRYRALNVTYNYVDFANPGYVDSIMEGASKLYQYIHDELKPENCPNQRILIFGYSQGALSAHLAINLMERQGDPALSMIAGVVLVSDPARIAWGGESLWQGVDVDDELVPAGVVVLPSNGAWTGAMNSTGVAEFTPTVAARTSAICHEHDPVCAYTLINSTFFPLQFFSFADHQNYSHSELNALGRSASLISLQP